MKKKQICLLACAAAVVLCAVLAGGRQRQVQLTVPSGDSPMGPRKILNYRGSRYAFLENGAAYDLEAGDMEEELGTLQYDILADPEENGRKDLAATFALGGTLWETKLWDPDFRVAVELENSIYLAERVDSLGDEAVDLSDYFAAADFAHTARTIEIRDHMGREVLDTLEGQDRRAMLDLLCQCKAAELENEDYPAIGEAQRSGGSFRLVLKLTDGTDYGLYVLPELGLAMLGDNKYSLPEDFRQSFGERFGGLTQGPLPAI